MADSADISLPARIYLGLGSNLGDRMGSLTLAVERLSQKLTISEISSVYETEPLGYKEQPLFLNAVVSAVTELGPFELLRFIKQIESDLGRKRGFRNAPRPIDIDILFYGDLVTHTHELTIPHPGVAERAFVLVPLVEIAPEFVHPLSQRKFVDLLAEVDGLGGVRGVGRLNLKGITTLASCRNLHTNASPLKRGGRKG